MNPIGTAATSRDASEANTGEHTEPGNQYRCVNAAAYAPTPNHAPWPNDTSPVWPTRMLSAMHATAKITTSVALVSVRPPASSANGSTTIAAAAITTGERAYFILFEALDPLAEEAARPHQKHQHHQQIHRGFRGGGIEI